MNTEHKTSFFPAQTIVSADTLWNHTGIILERGVKYRFSAQGVWKDSNIECGPDGYEMRQALPKYKWLIFWAAQFLKLLSTGERWFQLLGKVGDNVFVIGTNTVLTAPASGELLCAANDARGFFGNNEGTLTLVVTREAD